MGISLLLPPNLCDEQMCRLCVNPRCLKRLGTELVTSVQFNGMLNSMHFLDCDIFPEILEVTANVV